MVSAQLLAQIHYRLDEIFPNSNSLFGKQNIILLGDLFQVNNNLNFKPFY